MDLYVEVQQFYARQMQALDSGKFDEFAETFTEDGEFNHTAGRPSARTRIAIINELRDVQAALVTEDVQRRHWFNMNVITPLGDGTIKSTVYAMVMRILPGGKPEITFSGLAHDTLVRRDGQLYIQARTVISDAVRS